MNSQVHKQSRNATPYMGLEDLQSPCTSAVVHFPQTFQSNPHSHAVFPCGSFQYCGYTCVLCDISYNITCLLMGFVSQSNLTKFQLFATAFWAYWELNSIWHPRRRHAIVTVIGKHVAQSAKRNASFGTSEWILNQEEYSKLIKGSSR